MSDDDGPTIEISSGGETDVYPLDLPPAPPTPNTGRKRLLEWLAQKRRSRFRLIKGAVLDRKPGEDA